MQKHKIDLYHIPYTKMQLRMDREPEGEILLCRTPRGGQIGYGEGF